MVIGRWRLACFALLLVAPYTMAEEPGDPDPLFLVDGALDVTISAPLTTLMKERPDEEELPGKLQFTDASGMPAELDIQIRTRGRYRRQTRTCRFAPIRLNFKKSQVKGTVFEGQDKVKLVTHCRNNSGRLQQAVLSEYLAYRIMNVMSDVSFRVRLLRITYVDTDNADAVQVRLGFVIEHEDRLAKRIGKPIIEVERTGVGQLDPAYTSLVAVYHYLIGNTDWSPIAGAFGERCCHNQVLLGIDGERFFSVPYDFDMSGLVDAPYASANPRFNLRSVRDRLYRGRCVYIDQLPETLQQYRDKRTQLEHEIGAIEGYSDYSRDLALRYIDAFYDTINNPKRVERRLLRECI